MEFYVFAAGLAAAFAEAGVFGAMRRIKLRGNRLHRSMVKLLELL